MLFHGQASIAFCGPDIDRHKQWLSIFFPDSWSTLGEGGEPGSACQHCGLSCWFNSANIIPTLAERSYLPKDRAVYNIITMLFTIQGAAMSAYQPNTQLNYRRHSHSHLYNKSWHIFLLHSLNNLILSYSKKYLISNMRKKKNSKLSD